MGFETDAAAARPLRQLPLRPALSPQERLEGILAAPAKRQASTSRTQTTRVMASPATRRRAREAESI